MKTTEMTVETLTARYGRNQGLDANWNCAVWEMENGRWAVDNEDGTFSVCKREWNEDGYWVVSEVAE